MYKAPEIREITTALIQLSKASLSSEKFIRIRQELELTERYLTIQKCVTEILQR
ncbi:MAG: histidine kinase [Blautia sp.]